MLAINLRKAHRKCKSWIVFVSSIFLILEVSKIAPQVVSPELRRLAISTNQLGIDALRALDRIEPAEKAIVFCPVCLSSSLAMIMMGSSKYPAVSSLRQALYVWSMKPQEINRGFKDIFEYIGFNQPQFVDRYHKMRRRENSLMDDEQEASETRYAKIRDIKPKFPSIGEDTSLINLIQLRELLSRHMEGGSHIWWDPAVRNKSAVVVSSTVNQPAQSRYAPLVRQTRLPDHLKQPLDSDHLRRFLGDVSQMSALSNIYIQRGLTLNYSYNLLLRQFYKTVIHPIDFQRNWNETRQHINSLVASGTEGKIKELIHHESFERLGKPKIMMVSTFHFRGTLDIQIASKAEVQHRKDSGKSNLTDSTRKAGSFIDTEETLMKFGRFPEIGCNVVEIPFNNRLISLIIATPIHKNMTDLLLTRINAQVLNDMVKSLTVKKISIEIPVIKFDRGPINFEGLLKELNLSDFFYGNRSSNSETGLNRWLRPIDIIHETSIDIGTINPRWPQTEDRLKVGAHDDRSSNERPGPLTTNLPNENRFRLEKPFFYFVFDTINGLVLTMGRIRH